MLKGILRETAWAVLYVLTFVVCWSAGAQGLDPITQEMLEGEQSRIIRSYHLDRSGLGSSNLCDTSIGCPTLGVYFNQAVAATYVPEIGGAPLTLTVAGNPTLVNAGTYPAGFTTPGKTWRLDGTADSLSVADAAGAFAPPGAWSVVCGITPKVGFASGDVFVAKWNTTGEKRSWRLYTGGTSVVLDISADGTAGTITTLTKAAAIAANRASWITVTCDGAGNCYIYVDGLAVATSAAMPDPFVGDAALSIGADAEGAGDVPAELAPCAFYGGSISAATHARMAARWRGLYDGSGTQVVSVVNAAPPALQVAAPADSVEPFLVNMAANTTMLGKTASCSGLYGPSAVSNLVQYGSFETAALTGWTVDVGGTTGACAASTARSAHGSYSMRCSTADADDLVTATSACLTVTGGTAYRLTAWARLESGTGLLDINVLEDDSADCSSPTGTTAVINDEVPTAAWGTATGRPFSGNITTAAGTIRVQVQVSLPAAAAQALDIDAIQLRAGIVPMDSYCDAPTSATGVCSTSVTSHASALSANGAETIELTGCTPWAGTDGAAVNTMWGDGAGANSLALFIYGTSDEPEWFLRDAAAADKYNQPNTSNWSAATPSTLRAYFDGLGNMGLTWPVGTWFTTTGGAGTGIRSAAQALTYLCGSSVAGFDVWATGVKYYRGWMR
jgi:hypothetical protein